MDLSSVDAINWLVNEQLTHPSLTQEEKLHLFDRAAVLARRGLSHTPPPQLSCRSVSGKRVALAHPGAARSGWVTDISVCAPPPFEAAPAWLAQLSLGTLHVAMAVCHEWRRAAREDVRFHTLRVRAPLQAAEAQAADHLPSELDLSTAQVCTRTLHPQHSAPALTPRLRSAPAPRTRSAPLRRRLHRTRSAPPRRRAPLRRPQGSLTSRCASVCRRRGHC